MVINNPHTCVNCGIEFGINISNIRQFCDECRKERSIEHHKENYRRRTAKKQLKDYYYGLRVFLIQCPYITDNFKKIIEPIEEQAIEIVVKQMLQRGKEY